jgi:hypothetical protein
MATSPSQGKTDYSAHSARFRDVDNAEAIRRLIVDRLRLVKDAGLGDRDDHHPMPTQPIAPQTDSDSLQAAHEVLAECRLLRGLLA